MEMGFATVFGAISEACNGRVFSEEGTKKFLEGTCMDLTADKLASTSGRKIPLVVHNGLQDLLFLLTHCHNQSLPEEFEGTKRLVGKYFPTVYDTKVMVSEYADAQVAGGSTTLGELYEFICGCSDGGARDIAENAVAHGGRVPAPVIANKEGNDGGNGKKQEQGQAHEAAWDAYMTGCVFDALDVFFGRPRGRFGAPAPGGGSSRPRFAVRAIGVEWSSCRRR